MIKNQSKKYWLFFIKISIIIHLGRNPKNGGSPPNERKLNIKNIFKIGEIIKLLKIWLKWKILKFKNNNTIGIFNKQ